ncbi:MAG: 7-cyano-7-deazaguanine synthase QueC [Candidatus Omnitrophica bacterium]|nr:7-cyano-7-deazaguanine synthase QueC [Candidatus Omnitrophota bacterium]
MNPVRNLRHSRDSKISHGASPVRNSGHSRDSKISHGARAVILLSGGIDSGATLYYARQKGYKVFCLTFDYGQRHNREIDSARRLAEACGADWRLLKISLPWKGSALLEKGRRLPKGKLARKDIPSTYVPGRNIIFLSYAVSYAEAIKAEAVFIGANQIDYSGYPDCRDSFLRAFGAAVKRGTKKGVSGRGIRIKAPFINKTKSQIVAAALKMKVPIETTWSCYRGGRRPCGVCDSCLIRTRAFKEAGIYG